MPRPAVSVCPPHPHPIASFPPPPPPPPRPPPRLRQSTCRPRTACALPLTLPNRPMSFTRLQQDVCTPTVRARPRPLSHYPFRTPLPSTSPRRRLQTAADPAPPFRNYMPLVHPLHRTAYGVGAASASAATVGATARPAAPSSQHWRGWGI